MTTQRLTLSVLFFFVCSPLLSCSDSSGGDSTVESDAVSADAPAPNDTTDDTAESKDTEKTDTNEGDATEDRYEVKVCVIQDSDAGQVCIDEKTIDLGKLPAGEAGTGYIEIRNTGTLIARVEEPTFSVDSGDAPPFEAIASTDGVFGGDTETKLPASVKAGDKLVLKITLPAGQAPGEIAKTQVTVKTGQDDDGAGKSEDVIDIVGEVADCAEGLANCDDDWANGCETDLMKDAANCGECGKACTATNGTSSCEEGDCTPKCDKGWEGSDCSKDINECIDLPCHFNADCKNTEGSYTCACKKGYSGDGTQCDDVDECTDDTNNCAQNASCENMDGSFSCTCNDGYTGDGVTCTDSDECTDDTDNCDKNAACENTDGSFTCACNKGYTGDGLTCINVDECVPVMIADPPGTKACADCICALLPDCCDNWTEDCNKCASGEGADKCPASSCAAECTTPGANNCNDNDGSFDCACNSGYAGDGVDCKATSCPAKAEGDPKCACYKGYEGTLTWDDDKDTWTGECTNIDECKTETDNCHENAVCTDSEGDFSCTCNSGYAGDGVDCQLSECPKNGSGEPSCGCNKGYEGTLCWDYD